MTSKNIRLNHFHFIILVYGYPVFIPHVDIDLDSITELVHFDPIPTMSKILWIHQRAAVQAFQNAIPGQTQ